MIYQFPNNLTNSESSRKSADNEIHVQLDLKFDLPGRIAEQLEALGITEFEGCSYDPARRCLKACVETTLYKSA